MNRARVERTVIQLLRQTALDGSPRPVSLHDPLGEQGLDSLAFVEFVLAIEKAYRIQVPDDAWAQVATATPDFFVELILAAKPSGRGRIRLALAGFLSRLVGRDAHRET